MNKLAIIRIKGPVRVKYEVEDTMKMLHLNKKFNCVVIEDRPEFRGMIKKVEHLITWGKINDDTIKLLEKRMIVIEKRKNFFIDVTQLILGIAYDSLIDK